jgi:hypothetical protein
MSEPAYEPFLDTRAACLIALGLAVVSFSAHAWQLLHLHPVPDLSSFWLFGRMGSHVALAVRSAFYGLLLWGVVLSWVRTRGRERVFIVGWFSYPALVGVVSSLVPQWRLALGAAGLLGPAIAILAALSLLLDPQIGTKAFTADGRA